MPPIDRRRFLKAGLGAAGLAAAPAADAPRKDDDKKPKFRLGLVTYNLAANWDLPTLLKVCKAAGVSPVEFRTTHKHGVEPSLTKDERKDVKKRCADAGVDIWGCGAVCEFQSPDPPSSKRTSRRASALWNWSRTSAAGASRCGPTASPKASRWPRRSTRSARR